MDQTQKDISRFVVPCPDHILDYGEYIRLPCTISLGQHTGRLIDHNHMIVFKQYFGCC